MRYIQYPMHVDHTDNKKASKQINCSPAQCYAAVPWFFVPAALHERHPRLRYPGIQVSIHTPPPPPRLTGFDSNKALPATILHRTALTDCSRKHNYTPEKHHGIRNYASSCKTAFSCTAFAFRRAPAKPYPRPIETATAMRLTTTPPIPRSAQHDKLSVPSLCRCPRGPSLAKPAAQWRRKCVVMVRVASHFPRPCAARAARRGAKGGRSPTAYWLLAPRWASVVRPQPCVLAPTH